MSRNARLILMFVIASSLGLYLAYRERGNRENALSNTAGDPGIVGTGEVVRAAPAAEPRPAPAPTPVTEPKPAGPRLISAPRPQPKRDPVVAPPVEPRPNPAPGTPTRVY